MRQTRLFQSILTWHTFALAQSTIEVTGPDNYVFANARGGIRWPESFLKDHIKPAAERAGIGNVGWHTFRHTYATLLAELDTKPAVQKELLRHANISTTMNVYTQAVQKSLRRAARKAVKALL